MKAEILKFKILSSDLTRHAYTPCLKKRPTFGLL